MVAPPLHHCVLLNNLQAKVTEVIAAVRAAVGPDFTLMVDVQYAFDDPRAVADMVKEWDRLQLNIFFLETPLRMDQIKEMAELHTMLCEDSADGKTPRVRVAYGEWQVRARAVWCIVVQCGAVRQQRVTLSATSSPPPAATTIATSAATTTTTITATMHTCVPVQQATHHCTP